MDRPCCICNEEAQFYNLIDDDDYCEICEENKIHDGTWDHDDFELL